MHNRSQTLAFLVLSLVAIPAVSDEGRIPIFAAPTVIAAPGKYYVTGNLAIAAGSLVTITVDNVDIDLNGFVLSSTAAAPVITATGVNGVTIRNGTVSGGLSNIFIDTGTRIVLEDVQAIGATGLGSSGIRLEDCTQISVRRVMVRDAEFAGIAVINGFAVPEAEGTLADNLIEACGAGISVSSPVGTGMSSVSILDNRMKAIGTTGLFYSEGSGCVIARNTLDGIGSYGMFLQTYRCTLRDNVVSGAGAGGFGIQQNGDDNLILNNVVANGGDRGFAISGDRNNVEGNVANNNGSFGFTIFGTATLYRGNMARGNLGVAGDPPACAAPCSPDLCAPAALGNTSAGDNFLPGPPGFPACI